MPAALALVLGAGTWWLWPADSDLWRKVIAVFLSTALAFQVAVALRATGRAAVQAWLECGAFLLVQGAFLHLPSALGWLLLLTGWCWRFLVRNLWK
ncbi:hypothetical protein [Prosthecobacter vanneervenii]|uniref:Uncharacterized protein n=1 Tax=Prosthecobacter vanneervenii TaxID=48466 RepID=A0A7W7Y7W2_9BACT|nr:hypothetical protein [Prosthecobacter vanneervenii]MBB5031253.1 hypothetical protein [Prosthecobacter vanneervenii]